jgi:negative regulator of flagellin synthesis FlgM
MAGRRMQKPRTLRSQKARPMALDRVAALRARIANGFYPIDPQAIADRMIARDIVRGKASRTL